MTDDARNPIRISARPVRLAYFVRIPNVGDLVNPALVTALSGLPTVHSRDGAGHLLAIGSMMRTATPASHVWGTGVIHPDLGVGNARGENVHALRGKRSAEALRAAGVAVADVPLGDPGYLAPGLLGVRRPPRPAHRLGIVPHYTDRRHPQFRRLAQQRGVRLLDVHADPLRFLAEMADCAAVLSSSLHGLVFAEALGIPNLWVTAGDDIVGGAFKYEDWFSTMGRPQKEAVPLADGLGVDDLAGRAVLHDSMIDAQALADAFPLARMDEFREARERHIVPVAVCRTQPVPVFLACRNGGAALCRAVASIRGLATPTRIVVADLGSDDPATLDALAALEAEGIAVERRAAGDDGEAVIRATVARFFADWAEPQRYAVGDGSVDLSVADPLALEAYAELLNLFRTAEAAGPMLRIREVPKSHPDFAAIVDAEVARFWSKTPLVVGSRWGVVAYQHAAIDASFALHRAGEPFRTEKEGLRAYEPFEARRIGWDRPGDAARHPPLSPAGDAASPAAEGITAPRAGSYLLVERDETGMLRTRRRSAADNPD